MKTELLIQMDGLSKSDDLVFVLAASNLPWSAFFFSPTTTATCAPTQATGFAAAVHPR